MLKQMSVAILTGIITYWLLPSEDPFHPGYRDFTGGHRKRPVLEYDRLSHHCNELASSLSLPSMATQRNKKILSEIERLLDSLSKYRDHLKLDSDCHRAHRQQPAEEWADHETKAVLINSVHAVASEYKALDAYLSELQSYEVLDRGNFTLSDRVHRRRYVNNLELKAPITFLRIAYGGSLGTLNFIWKVPVTDSEAERLCRNTAATERAKLSVPKYCSRAVRRDFVQKYSKQVKTKGVLRHMFAELTGCANAAECDVTAKVDDRTAEFFLSGDDPEVLLDLRSVSSNADKTKFDVFFTEVEGYFTEQLMAVQERRHGDEMYLPMAISVDDLKREVTKRLPEGTPVPCAETLRLQFHPMNEYVKTAQRYTGRFNVKFRVQTRMARLIHPDQRYVATQYQYLKELSVQNKEHVLFVCLDDKAVVPVGEPGVPISTGVRGHNRVPAPVDGPTLVATDHDFHVAGLVPSVAHVVSIPDDSKDSFFKGQVCVTTKDKVFQPSSPMRHATELTSIWSSLEEGSEKPVLVVFSDGGPDHRVTYDTVKLSLLSLFLELDLDMLIALRTAPHSSWMNPAERVMSVLNLALQHVALERKPMVEKYESKVKGKSTMTAVRNTAGYIDGVKEAYLASTKPVIELVNGRFGRMEIKGVPLRTFPAATDVEVESMLNVVRQYTGCQDLTATVKDVKACKPVMEFFRKHAKSTNYCFQLRKCMPDDAHDCDNCVQHPARIEEVEFASLHFLPDPTPDSSGEHYQSFAELYGQATTETHRPSLAQAGISPEDQQSDKENAEVLKSGKVRGVVHCCECNIPRCIYTHKKLTSEQETEFKQIKEQLLYVCGHPLVGAFVTRRSLTCTSPVETVYYSATCLLPPVCCHCGGEEDLLDDFDEFMENFREKFSTVRPLCETCKNAGKEPKTWGAKFFKKRKTN